MPGAEQLQFRPSGHQPLAGVKHVAHVATVGGNGGHPDQRPTMHVCVPGLGRCNVEAPPKFRDHRSDQ